MAVIDPVGLFGGDRLRRCSNAAQLHWPRLFLASDGFGRLEMNYARIVGRAYPTFNPIPSETELQSFIQEYARNYLLFLFEVDGRLWGQWDTRRELLPRYKTSQDRRSPIPPEPAFSEWKRSYREQSTAFPKSFGKIPAGFLHGVGIGEGVGEKHSCSSDNERDRKLCSIDEPPFDTLELLRDPEQRDAPAKSPTWGLKEKQSAFREGFWPLWPRKVAKAVAEKAWCREATSPAKADKIIEAVRAQLPRLSADLMFCPYPTTWLNQKRYEDEVEDTAAVDKQASPYTQAEEDE